MLFEYVQNADAIVACPTNKRRPHDDRDVSILRNDGLSTDYTMNGNTHGNKTYIAWRVVYLNDPSLGQPTYLFAVTLNAQPGRITPLPGVPLLMEESTAIENQNALEARWLSSDRLAERHNDGAHVTYPDGAVELFVHPAGELPDVAEPVDFSVEALYYDFKIARSPWRQKPSDGSTVRWGWLNNTSSDPDFRNY